MTNRTITMLYLLKDANTKDILEQSMQPVKFVSGLGQLMPKLEESVLSLYDGAKKTITILSADGAGEYDATAVQSLPKEQFAGLDLKEGMELFGQGENGQSVRVVVKAIGDEEVMVDFNHPFAGKDLEFDVEILENRASTENEIQTGMPDGMGHSCGCGNNGNKGDGCCGHHHDDEHECCGGNSGGCGCH